MKTSDFIEIFINVPNVNKEEYLGKIVVVDYLPIKEKLSLCEKVTKASCYKNEELHIDSIANYVLFTLSVIDAYTEIDIDFSNILNEYDLLNKDNTLGGIMDNISESELKELSTLLGMLKDDLMQNEYYIGAYLSNRLNNLDEILGAVLEPVADKLLETLENLDDEQIDKITNTVKGKGNKFMSLFKK